MASSASIFERFILNFLDFYFSISFVYLKNNCKKLQEKIFLLIEIKFPDFYVSCLPVNDLKNSMYNIFIRKCVENPKKNFECNYNIMERMI